MTPFEVEELIRWKEIEAQLDEWLQEQLEKELEESNKQ